MAQGTIRNLIGERGFGLIRPEGEQGTGSDLFFHRGDVQGTTFEELQVGQAVAYDLGRDERRRIPKATNVRSLPT